MQPKAQATSAGQTGERELLQSAEYRVSSIVIPLIYFPLDSNIMIGAEIAGSSLPDERTPCPNLLTYCLVVIQLQYVKQTDP